MSEDETGMLERLDSLEKGLVEPTLAMRHGRIVKRRGKEGFLAKFPNAVEAVSCAIDIQRAMAERNAGLSEDRQIRFRIFCTKVSSWVVSKGDGIDGDDIAVRLPLDEMVDPGGICIGSGVRMQIMGKIDAVLQILSRGRFTGVEHIVHIFALNFDGKPRSCYPLYRDPPK